MRKGIPSVGSATSCIWMLPTARFPVSALLTSASLHDSQAAIPLAMLSAGRLTNLYDLMDSAYDAPEIRARIRELGHVPIIDKNPRSTAVKEELETEARARKAA